jgi:protein-tyrosine phosphatase
MYRITRVLSVGRFASPERAEQLLAAGVTHVLNVSDAPSQVLAAEPGFREVAWVPLQDSRTWPTALTIRALDALHRLVVQPDSHVYVHCIAGQLRSPTLLWLYLIACGIPADDARDWIEERSPDAIPGDHRLVNQSHVLLAQLHGLKHYFPLARGEVIVPFPVEPGPE